MKPFRLFGAVIAFICTFGLCGGASAADDSPSSLDRVLDEEKGVISLDTTDPTYTLWNTRRDTASDPRREPGPINLNRDLMGSPFMGIPTFYRQPVAMNKADLVAGKVDAAFLGMPFDFSSVRRGSHLGPQAVRTAEVLVSWRSDGEAFVEHTDTMIDPFHELNVVDYGDAPVEFLSVERTLAAAVPLVREAAEVGVVLLIAGGSHSVPYPAVRGIVEAHGKGSVGVIHFDAHQDAAPYGLGHPVHYGTWIKTLVDDGLVEPKNIIQVGMRGPANSKWTLDWQRELGLKVHYMAEIRKRGWDAVMRDILAEALDGPKMLYISLDLDFFDASVTPGTTAPEHGGVMPVDFWPLLRGLFIQNQVVGMDIVEINPLVDNQSRSTMLLAARTFYEGLVGLALRKKGITDPDYIHPGLISGK